MLVLDIGGSFIKYGLANEKGELLPGTTDQVASNADGDYEAFLDILRHILHLNQQKMHFTKASVSIPGPFDYFHGISLMQHKFKALYQKSISLPFEEEGIEVCYLHDSTAFMLGEASERDGSEACGVMLGTGLGFSMMRQNRVCVNQTQTPAFVLWNMPWRDGIAEDYVSKRAILSLYGKSDASVRAIAAAAQSGDEKAQRVFATVGENLSGILQKILPELGCGSLVLGGQISKSADLFHLDIPVPWRVCEAPEETALRGAGRFAALGRDACVCEMDTIRLP